MCIRRAILALAIAATMTAGVAACGDDDDSGASTGGGDTSTGTTVAAGELDPSKPDLHIAMVTLKIPGSDLLTPYTTGAQAAADQINAEGGFGGRKVVIDSCNSMLQPSAVALCARRTLDKDPVAMVGCDPSWGTAGLPVYSRAGVPSIYCVQSEAELANPMAFGLDGSGVGQIAAMATWLCTKPEITRVVDAILDVPQLRKEFPATVDPILEGCGKQVKSVFIPLTATDFTPVKDQIMQFKPDFVMFNPLAGPQAVQIYKAFEADGFPASKTMVISSSFDPDKVLKVAGSAAEGAYAMMSTANMQDTSNPDVPPYRKAVEAKGGSPDDPLLAQAYMFVMAIHAVAEDIGFDKFDSKALADYLNTQSGLHLPMSRQLVNPGPEGSVQVKQPYFQFAQWTGGKIVTVKEGTEDGWMSGFPGSPATGG